MILDYKNNKELALANGIMPENSLGETHFVACDVISNATFRNFKNLCLDDTCFEDCIFENCSCVTTESCHMKMCTFKNVDSIDGVRTDFSNCTFKDCCSDGPFLCIDSRGCVENCTFDTITALDDSQGYVIYSVYGKKKEVEIISGCKFINCQVENEDGELCYCSYFKPFSSFNTIQVDNVDYETCHFESCGPIEV